MKLGAIVLLALILAGGTLSAQQIPNAFVPGHPGAPTQGYFQPVQVRGPDGTQIAFSINGQFVQRTAMPYAVGLLLNGDYRLRVTDIPHHPGKEVFPTIKLLARTFPPRGKELEFPIQINLTQEDLEEALVGKYVTRVIYLENPNTAIPAHTDLNNQLSMDVGAGFDPLEVAQTMGQPVAIVRIGGRMPSPGVVDPTFFFGCPPWMAFDKTPSGMFEVTRFQNTPMWMFPQQQRQQQIMVDALPNRIIR